jgi:hypothetical protein
MWLVHAGVIRFAGRHWAGTEDRGLFLRSLLRAWTGKLPWLLLAVAIVSWFLGRGSISGVLNVAVPLLVASALLSVSAIVQACQQAKRDHWRDLVVSSVGSLSRSFLPPLFYFQWGCIEALYLGFLAHAMLSSMAAVWSVMRYWRGSAGAKPIEAVYDGPLFVAIALSSWGLAGVNRWIAAYAFGDVEAGLFTLANNIAQIVPAVLGAVVLQFFQPGFYAMADTGGDTAMQRLCRRVDLITAGFAAMSLVGLFALQGVAPLLLGVLIDHRYAEAIPWIVPAGCFGITTMAGHYYHVMLLAGHRERACGWADLSCAAVLVTAVFIAGQGGQAAFKWTLLASPLLILVINRPIARGSVLRVSRPAP